MARRCIYDYHHLENAPDSDPWGPHLGSGSSRQRESKYPLSRYDLWDFRSKVGHSCLLETGIASLANSLAAEFGGDVVNASSRDAFTACNPRKGGERATRQGLALSSEIGTARSSDHRVAEEDSFMKVCTLHITLFRSRPTPPLKAVGYHCLDAYAIASISVRLGFTGCPDASTASASSSSGFVGSTTVKRAASLFGLQGKVVSMPCYQEGGGGWLGEVLSCQLTGGI